MKKKRIPIHPIIKERLGFALEMSDKEVLRIWRERSRNVCKPCWELKYCPYGPLVEQFPLLPQTLEEARHHLEYAQKCLSTGKVGEATPLSPENREIYEQCVKDFDPDDYEPDPRGDLTAMQLAGHGKETDLTREAAIHVNERMKRSLETGMDGHYEDMTPAQKAMFEQEVAEFNESKYPVEIPPQIAEMQCTVFGHICPVLYSAERITETIELRRTGRYIPFQTKIRVVRRDNYTCQHCGRHLLDNEVEFDHVIPIAKGGSSEEHNIRLTCFDCNRNKSDRVEV
jgi:hypothetical protein